MQLEINANVASVFPRASAVPFGAPGWLAAQTLVVDVMLTDAQAQTLLNELASKLGLECLERVVSEMRAMEGVEA